MKKNLSKTLLFLACSLLVLSSTCQKKTETQTRIVTVPIEDSSQAKGPNVSSNKSISTYGPESSSSQVSTSNIELSTSSIGIIIGPSEVLDSEVLDYISCLLKSDRKISFISGIGNGAIIASLFAQKPRPEYAKWKIFRLNKNKDNIEELGISSKLIRRSDVGYYISRITRPIMFKTKGNILSDIENQSRETKNLYNTELLIDESSVENLVADKIILFRYNEKFTVAPGQLDDKIIAIKINGNKTSLIQKCNLIEEKL